MKKRWNHVGKALGIGLSVTFNKYQWFFTTSFALVHVVSARSTLCFLHILQVSISVSFPQGCLPWTLNAFPTWLCRSLYFSIKEQTHYVKINFCLDFLLNFKFFGGQGLSWASQVSPEVKNLPAREGETRDVGLNCGLGTSPGVENCSSIFAWKIPWAEAPGGLQTIGP